VHSWWNFFSNQAFCKRGVDFFADPCIISL
jgi:hypothetical protein